jgi:hypothetical protein
MTEYMAQITSRSALNGNFQIKNTKNKQMKTNQTLEYKTPQVNTLTLCENGILCSSTFGAATTDDFTIGEDISDIF